MKKKSKIVILIIVLIAIITTAVIVLIQRYSMISESSAKKRLLEFADAVNYNKPAIVYNYLTEDQKNQISKDDFVKNFAHERSYPYLTPFFINYLGLKMNEDGRSGTAYFSVAARLPGEIYEQPFYYENGNYYMRAFQDIVDGTYIKKFDRLK